LRAPSFRRSTVAYALLLVGVGAYLMFARTRHISESFLMLRDQIRDWRFALGPLGDLPLTGTQSTAGGSSLGPIYYWILWLTRHIVGPWTDNLPHAGAIGLSAVQTAADLLLLHALRRRTGSTWLAIAATLFTATASHDLAVSATIWNPVVSIAFAKMAIALLLLSGPSASIGAMVATVACAWFAVQAHSAAIFLAGPVIAVFALPALAAHRWSDAVRRISIITAVILTLQLPFLYHAVTQAAGAGVGPGRALASASHAMTDLSAFRLAPSTEALVHSLGRILFVPWYSPWWRVLLLASALGVIVRARKDAALLAVTIVPLVCAAFGFALWQGRYDEYWYLPLAPSAALMIVFTITSWRPRQTAIVCLVGVLLMQPGRLAHSQTWYRMPEYGALTRGAREILMNTPAVRRVDTTFRMPPLSDRTFPYIAMGGRLSLASPFDATIDANGHATLTAVPR
jgi:hypothetical protein